MILSIKDSAIEDDLRFSLAANPLNELADNNYNVIDNAILLVDIIKTEVLGINPTSQSDQLNFSNYPNPFKGTTNFTYSLPTEGFVTLIIYDVIGNKITEIVDKKHESGNHSIELKADNLEPGIYTATLQFKNEETIIIKTIKIINK
jgi:hypothetical protein